MAGIDRWRGFLTGAICGAVVVAACGVVAYKYATLESDDHVVGLTGKERSYFVEAGIDTCVKQAAQGFTTESISQYCRCFSNGLADRLSKNEVKSMDKMTQAEMVAAVQPKSDAVAATCDKLLTPR